MILYHKVLYLLTVAVLLSSLLKVDGKFTDCLLYKEGDLNPTRIEFLNRCRDEYQSCLDSEQTDQSNTVNEAEYNCKYRPIDEASHYLGTCPDTLKDLESRNNLSTMEILARIERRKVFKRSDPYDWYNSKNSVLQLKNIVSEEPLNPHVLFHLVIDSDLFSLDPIEKINYIVNLYKSDPKCISPN